MKTCAELVAFLLEFDGISRKFVLPHIISRLRMESYNGDQPYSLGEDSAVIGTDCDHFVLHTTDAIVEELCTNFPQAAGFNVVLANIMDIYAAGGTPTSFAVALSYSDPDIGEAILQGLIEGSHAFKIPIARGHTNPKSAATYVVGSATGIVKKQHLITAGNARSGDVLLLLYDTTGRRGSSYRLGWDSVTDKKSDQIVHRLSVMNELAESGLLHASKDVSVAGVVGTAGMMLEYSDKGGVLDIQAIATSCPDELDLEDWLRMFISLGFLVSLDPANLPKVMTIAQSHAMSAVKIGSVDANSSLRLQYQGDECVMFDWSTGPILTPKGGSSPS